MTTPTMTVTTPSEREIALIRDFDAPRALVFEAYTTPALVKRWLGNFGGWTLPVCEIDLRVGGRYRYEWHHPTKPKMGSSGVFKEIVVPERIVATEKFDDAWYDGECLGTTTFTEHRGKTTLTMTLMYASRDVRDKVLKSGMDTGVAKSFDEMAAIIAASKARA
jgi:uncharacterized protein YndB with AHSA1/START domain